MLGERGRAVGQEQAVQQVGTATEPSSEARTGRALGDRPRLILLSFLMLFVELALIRWLGSNILYLSYFSNFVLLGSFLGIGLGFLHAGRRPVLFPWSPVALAVLVVFVRTFPVTVRNTGTDLIYFGELKSSGPPRELVLVVIFLAVAATLAFVADGVARTFMRFEALEAYKLDLIGSVFGIAVYVLVSFLGAPPLVWGIIVAAAFLALMLPERRLIPIGALLLLVLVLGIESFAANTSWSPYYKIETAPNVGSPGVSVKVNGVPHQAELSAAKNPLYSAAYSRAKVAALDDVLVVGAGTGNDVAVALRNGAKHIDAVEIDPRIREIGGETHPDRPYSDARVHTHINDGRAYLENSDRKYDLILFALPDSITLIQGQSSLRLESYLFTKESIESARSHLKRNGVFAMYNYYREQWLVDRYANTLDQAFNRSPCVVSIGPPGTGALAILMDAPKASSVDCETPAPAGGTAGVWQRPARVEQPATDDHPFPYLKGRSLPSFYVVTILLILLFSAIAVRVVGGPLRPMVRYIDLFFMGAAFLLLETKSVVQFALLFGTTWFVNALVFLGVLGTVLLAVLIAQRVTFRHPARLYLVLLASLVLAWLVPPDQLLGLPAPTRFLAATALAFLPIFTANLVFASRFKETAHIATAFGANLLGAMFGGLLEYASLVVGYRALLFLVALLYGLAFLTGRTHLRAGVAA
jgi:hypothetical protein